MPTLHVDYDDLHDLEYTCKEKLVALHRMTRDGDGRLHKSDEAAFRSHAKLLRQVLTESDVDGLYKDLPEFAEAGLRGENVGDAFGGVSDRLSA